MSRKSEGRPGGGGAAASEEAGSQPAHKPALEKKQPVVIPPTPEERFVSQGLALLDRLGPQARRRAQAVRIRCGDLARAVP